MRLIGISRHAFQTGHAREHQHSVHAGLNAGHHVGVHAVADDNGVLRRGLQAALGVAHHQRVGLADEVRLPAAGHLDGGNQGAAGRGDAVFNRAGDIRVCAQELRAVAHQMHGLLDFFKAVAAGFAHDHIVRVYVVHGKARVVKRAHQPRFANDIGGTAGALAFQIAGRGQGAGVKVLLAHVQAQPVQLLLQFLGAALRRIGQKDIFLAVFLQPVHKFPHAGQQQIAVIDHAVHIADKRLFPKQLFQGVTLLCGAHFPSPERLPLLYMKKGILKSQTLLFTGFLL